MGCPRETLRKMFDKNLIDSLLSGMLVLQSRVAESSSLPAKRGPSQVIEFQFSCLSEVVCATFGFLEPAGVPRTGG